MDLSTSKEKGSRGEDLASDFLLSKGCIIKKRNWRFGRYEVDIIAECENTLIFAEIKYRTGKAFKETFFVVTPKQRFNLIKAANYYIEVNSIQLESRFDILEIVEVNGEKEIIHHINAFAPDVNQV